MAPNSNLHFFCHVRPDTYIGSPNPVTEKMYVLDKESNRIVQKEITYSPGKGALDQRHHDQVVLDFLSSPSAGLFKIFDEILVNAADNKQRDPKGMDTIRIDISAEKGEIRVYNNGEGIPIEEHKDEKMYVPTLIFGHLLTSSNFDDEEEVTRGCNG